MALYLLSLCLVSTEAQSYPIHIQAANCLYLARRLFNEKPFWPTYTREVCGLEEHDLGMARLIAYKYVNIVNKSVHSLSKYQAVIEKFTAQKYSQVALYIPCRQ